MILLTWAKSMLLVNLAGLRKFKYASRFAVMVVNLAVVFDDLSSQEISNMLRCVNACVVGLVLSGVLLIQNVDHDTKCRPYFNVQEHLTTHFT